MALSGRAVTQLVSAEDAQMTQMDSQQAPGGPQPLPTFMTGSREDRFDGEITPDEKTMGMLAHLSALSGLLTGGIGLILGPILVWVLKKESSRYVDIQGKEAVNFWISMFIYSLVTCGISLLFGIVMAVIASIKANDQIIYRYPLTIRLIK
jgi:uncharacterized Tic20 family protein